MTDEPTMTLDECILALSMGWEEMGLKQSAATHLARLRDEVARLEDKSINAMQSCASQAALTSRMAEQQSDLGIVLDKAGFKGLYFPRAVEAACAEISRLRAQIAVMIAAEQDPHNLDEGSDDKT